MWGATMSQPPISELVAQLLARAPEWGATMWGATVWGATVSRLPISELVAQLLVRAPEWGATVWLESRKASHLSLESASSKRINAASLGIHHARNFTIVSGLSSRIVGGELPKRR